QRDPAGRGRGQQSGLPGRADQEIPRAADGLHRSDRRTDAEPEAEAEQGRRELRLRERSDPLLVRLPAPRRNRKLSGSVVSSSGFLHCIPPTKLHSALRAPRESTPRRGTAVETPDPLRNNTGREPTARLPPR